MSSSVPVSPAQLGSLTRILVLTVAAIGFLFDTYELLMFPVIGADAVGELIKVNQDGSLPGWLAGEQPVTVTFMQQAPSAYFRQCGRACLD